MDDVRLIKKYPNRRLYDTFKSSYITLEDVRKLVVEKASIKVMDARTQQDITHLTLLQIIMEREEKGPSLFSNDSLQQLIRFYSTVMHNLSHLSQWQQQWRHAFRFLMLKAGRGLEKV